MAPSVEATEVHGVWFRHLPGGQPLFRPQHPADGRWQRGEVVEGFYLAESEATAWAEWRRTLEELGLPPERMLPRDLWRFQVDVRRVANLSTQDRLERAGLAAPLADRRQWPLYQAVGERLYRQRWRGVLYSAAARSDGLALCLFRRTAALRGVRPLPPAVTKTAP